MLAQRHPALDITLEWSTDGSTWSARTSTSTCASAKSTSRTWWPIASPRAARACAAPSYLANAGTPARVGELSRHDCLVLRDRNQAFGVGA
jgi:LysR family transcriptional activator of dmlA